MQARPFQNRAVRSTSHLAHSIMENGASTAKDPSGFLSDIVGAPVTVKLNSGVIYQGELGSANSSAGLDDLQAPLIC